MSATPNEDYDPQGQEHDEGQYKGGIGYENDPSPNYDYNYDDPNNGNNGQDVPTYTADNEAPYDDSAGQGTTFVPAETDEGKQVTH